MKGYIYLITNKKNAKKYVGKTTDPERRWKQHKRPNHCPGMAITKAINKYGADNFKFEIIEEVNLDKVNEKEKYWIDYYNAYKGQHYNQRPGGEGFGTGQNHIYFGEELPEEVKEKLSRANSGKKNGFYGESHDQENKEIMSKAKENMYLKEENPNCKVDKEQALKIIKDRKGGMTQKELGQKYGVHRKTIQKIVNCKHWTTKNLNYNDSNYKVKPKSSGDKHYKSKINQKEAIKALKIRKNEGLSYRKIGEMFGVSGAVIGRICRHEHWTTKQLKGVNND